MNDEVVHLEQHINQMEMKNTQLEEELKKKCGGNTNKQNLIENKNGK